MGPVRRTINFLFALALTVAGFGGLIYLVLFADGWRGFMPIGAGFIGFLGAYWLWADFIKPDERPE
jgi:hypothetical protein